MFNSLYPHHSYAIRVYSHIKDVQGSIYISDIYFIYECIVVHSYKIYMNVIEYIHIEDI